MAPGLDPEMLYNKARLEAVVSEEEVQSLAETEKLTVRKHRHLSHHTKKGLITIAVAVVITVAVGVGVGVGYDHYNEKHR